ncbi:DUF4097 family beta strand repeat-containing protein [Nakamurella aerolata]|uniref:DUF4097 family beta strand repeat protein n=1 Tax=Nakamurella aerolata TaxID=1656892 RepID=A0A849A0U2_9ACTN|nr:DUF4097 family beta strand repeat-containing protein [Nakamurella aerolata]NNG34259.1 DUF4097 family beta strand repeat protein [Nakamurella aerolata]
MKNFLTPDPIVIEVRNAAGFVTVDLTDDVTTSTVEVLRLPSGVGLLDDLVAAFRRSDADTGAAPVAVTDEVRIDLRVTEQGNVLIVDTEPDAAEFGGPVGRWGSTPAYGVRIVAPRNSGLRAQTRSADLTITGVADRLDVRSASGEVVADTVRRASLVQTASGDIRLSMLGADAEVRTASGGIVVERVAGSLSVHSTSGNVRVEEPSGDVFVRSVSGDVRILDAVDGSVQATAVSGDVEIGVHRGSLARINLSTVTGSTINDFDVVDDPTDLDAFDTDDRGAADDPSGPGDSARLADRTADFTVDLDKARLGGTPAAAGETKLPDANSDSGSDSDAGSGSGSHSATAARSDDATGRQAGPGGRLEITCRTTSGDIRLRRAAAVAV